MPALNFFRLYPKQKENLIQFVVKRGLAHLESKIIHHLGMTFTLSLYFSSSPKKSYVKWIKHLQEVFKVPDKKIDNYSAVMLISSRNLLYAVSYGVAHFFISRFADIDFGVNIASRILSSYTIKNSRSFGGRTTKTISTYNNIPELVFDGGESVSYIKGRPTDSKKWGRSVSCGQSVQLRKREFNPTNAHELAVMLEKTLNKDPVKTEIPRSIRINDKPTIARLTDALIRDMESGNYMFSISAQQLSGVEFIFSDMYTYHIKHESGEIELESSLNLQDADALVKKHFNSDYSNFLKAEVEAREDGERAFVSRLIHFVDYVDSNNKYYLEEGTWYKFDTNYLRYLQHAVSLIPIDLSPEMRTFDESAYQKWLKAGKRSKTEYYRERFLNELLSNKFGYKNYDRNILKYEKMSIEFADLVRDDEFVFVKIGIPQKLNYVIDQSINAIRVLQHMGFHIDIDGKRHLIKKITLWLFLNRKDPISSLNELHSLIFLMKLANWRKEVLLSGCNPLIKVSYST